MIRLFPLLLLLLLINACRCTTAKTYLLTDKTHHLFVDFGNESYWIYQNEDDPSDIDTLKLCNKKMDLVYNTVETNCDGDYNETISYCLANGRQDTIKMDVRSGTTLDIIFTKGIYRNTQMSFYTDLDKEKNAFALNPKDTLKYHTIYSVKGTDYKDVYEFTLAQLKYSHPERFIFSKDVGMIAFSIYDVQQNKQRSYQLIGYKIIN